MISLLIILIIVALFGLALLALSWNISVKSTNKCSSHTINICCQILTMCGTFFFVLPICFWVLGHGRDNNLDNEKVAVLILMFGILTTTVGAILNKEVKKLKCSNSIGVNSDIILGGGISLIVLSALYGGSRLWQHTRMSDKLKNLRL